MPDPENLSRTDVKSLARDLRQSIGAFVRAVRRDPDTRRSAQSETLGLLDREGPMNVAAIAEIRNVKHQTMRLIAAQLEEAGFVQRNPNPSDRRSQLVSITEPGRIELARGREARSSRIEDMIRSSLSDEEQRTLRSSIALLERMNARANLSRP